jgi:hypothetical protein
VGFSVRVVHKKITGCSAKDRNHRWLRHPS